MNAIFDFAYRGGKVRRFFAIGAIAFSMAFVMFAVVSVPFALAGVVPWSAALGGAAGCGIGTGIVNAIFVTISA